MKCILIIVCVSVPERLSGQTPGRPKQRTVLHQIYQRWWEGRMLTPSSSTRHTNAASWLLLISFKYREITSWPAVDETQILNDSYGASHLTGPLSDADWNHCITTCRAKHVPQMSASSERLNWPGSNYWCRSCTSCCWYTRRSPIRTDKPDRRSPLWTRPVTGCRLTGQTRPAPHRILGGKQHVCIDRPACAHKQGSPSNPINKQINYRALAEHRPLPKPTRLGHV